MTRVFLKLALGLLLAACSQLESDTGPIYAVQDPLYNWVTAPDSLHPGSDRAPVVEDPVVTFQLRRGEHKTTLLAVGGYGGNEWRTGATYLFGFDVRLDPRTLRNERVSLARLSRRGTPETEIVSVDLDSTNGVTVMGRRCIDAVDLLSWHRVEIRVKLSDTDTGYLEVFCDREPIWARTGLRTTFPPICRLSEGCIADASRPRIFDVQMGLMSNDGVSHPIMVQMQKLHYRRIFYVPNRVGAL